MTVVVVNECVSAPPGSVAVIWWNQATQTPLTWQFNYSKFASHLPRQLEADEQDWIEVFGALYAIDRVSQRPPSLWSRDIEAHIPVRHPAKWRPQESALRDVWSRLTGDRLSIQFYDAVQPMPPPRPDGKIPPGVDGTALFSGGLDSFATVAMLASRGTKPALLTHMANQQVSTSVRSLLAPLAVPRPAPLPMIAKNGANSGLVTDESQRARSLLYVASAVLSSKTFEVTPVWVGENGILGVHEPETEARVPSLSTRTAHPQVLAAVADLSRSALGYAPSIENPIEHLTKAGVVQLIDTLGHAGLVPSAVSCWSSRSPQHCGYCIPCLQRFVATDIAAVTDNVYAHNPWDAAKTTGATDDERDNLIHLIQLAQSVAGANDILLEFRHPGLIGVGGSLTDLERLQLHRNWAGEVLQVAGAHARSAALL